MNVMLVDSSTCVEQYHVERTHQVLANPFGSMMRMRAVVCYPGDVTKALAIEQSAKPRLSIDVMVGPGVRARTAAEARYWAIH